MRRFTLACAGLLACSAIVLGAAPAPAALARAKTEAAQRQAAIAWLSRRLYAYQRATWHWQLTMGVRRSPTAGRVLARMSVPDVKRAVAVWKARARKARLRARRPPHLHAFLCIHRFEGSWHDGSGPYYGGLQMDVGFQRTYAPHLFRRKGTADHWTPLEQIWTAEKAHRSRGFWPWPSTARYCGLI